LALADEEVTLNSMNIKHTDKLQRLLLVIFGIAILSILVLTLLAYLEARKEEQNRKLASLGNEQIMLVKSVVRSVLQAESSQRAYFLSGEPVYKEELEATVLKLNTEMSKLEQMDALLPSTSGDHTARLLTLVNDRISQLESKLALEFELGLQTVQQSIHMQEGKQMMDELRDIAEQINLDERRFIAKSALMAERSASHRIYLLLGAVTLNLLLLSLAYSVVRKATARNAELLSEVRAKTQEIASINEFSSNLQSCSTVTEAHELFKHYMQRLFPECSGALYIMRSSRNLLHLATCWREGKLGFEDMMEPRDCWALRRGKTHVVTDTQLELNCRHINQDSHASLCIPLISQSETIGMLHLRCEDKQMLEVVSERADAMIHHISASLSGIFLREALREHSIRDPMTQLFNRRYLEESIAREHIRARRTNSQFTVVMADVDHFKTFNDNYGHQAGDAVIKAFANHLLTNVRGEDVVCRYGGEEFLILLVGATHEQGMERAEFLRQTSVTLEPKVNGTSLPSISASWGVATFPTHGESWEGIISTADAALYLSKRNGRNRVSSAKELAKLNPDNEADAL
jgi:diguanylate cyclase (GGDEF)-like protein